MGYGLNLFEICWYIFKRVNHYSDLCMKEKEFEVS